MKTQNKNTESFFHRYRYDVFVLVLVVVLTIVFWNSKDSLGMFESRETFETFVAGFGVWGPLVIVLSIATEVVVAPIPGYIPAVVAGFAFGPLWGTLYVYLGNIVGTLIVFWLARRFGKKLVEHFVKKERLEKYEKMIGRHENWLLAFYFFPVVPIDIITAAFGLSKIPLKKFVIVASLGYILYSVVSTNFGDYLAKLWF